MTTRSAGILLYKETDGALHVLLVHPGGPFWKRKDLASWSIPKGEHGETDDPLAAAVREFSEETGMAVSGVFRPLGELVQPSRKVVAAWAVEGDFEPQALKSNVFEMEWPPRSGRRQSFPEVDRAEWFAVADARKKILPGQAAFLDRLIAAVGPRDD
jgi:predicted NUDIX family NTP pyrophosphohydrolase